MPVLTVNAGSSSLKLGVLSDADELVSRLELEHTGGEVDRNKLAELLRTMGPIDAVGHRVVHGGIRYAEPVRLGPEVRDYLAGLESLAPLHQGAAVQGMRAVEDVLPAVPAVACFDTAFHRTLPAAAYTYALPAEYRDGVRRFGFHGLSHSYASRRVAELLHRDVRELRTVVCHLGSGASLAAVENGRSVDTTMGFTPLEGLVMATRCGNVDAGLLLWLQQTRGIDVAELRDALEHRSGLAGLAGTSDMAEVLDRAGRGEEAAVLAVEVYCHRLRGLIGSMAAAMNGCDALVFTGRVGERAAVIRRMVADRLGFLGVRIDPERNQDVHADTDISAPEAAVRTVVIEAREDIEIARQVRRALRP
ncbi:MAG TPA: acetate/propionate family kinase [Mycobacteriales bacterium]|nr:acetate/propionate family kinase [Mycobacteriales bacterium]